MQHEDQQKGGEGSRWRREEVSKIGCDTTVTKKIPEMLENGFWIFVLNVF